MGGLGIDMEGIGHAIPSRPVTQRAHHLKDSMKRLIHRLRGQSLRLNDSIQRVRKRPFKRAVFFPLLDQLQVIPLNPPSSDSLFNALSDLNYRQEWRMDPSTYSPQPVSPFQPSSVWGANVDMITTSSYTGPWDAIDYESGEYGSSHPLIRGFFSMYSHSMPPQQPIDWMIFYVTQYEIFFDLSIKIIELKNKMIQMGSWIYQLSQTSQIIDTIPINPTTLSVIPLLSNNGYQPPFNALSDQPLSVSINTLFTSIHNERDRFPSVMMDQLNSIQTNWLSTMVRIPSMDYTKASLDYMSHVKHGLKIIDRLLGLVARL